MISAQGSLTILNANTGAPQVYWNGVLLTDVKRVHLHSDEDENRVKIVVASGIGEQEHLYAEMLISGIIVRKERAHV